MNDAFVTNLCILVHPEGKISINDAWLSDQAIVIQACRRC